MKASQTTLDSLSDMHSVTSKGDLRRIIATSLLALARKEISATDVCAMAKGLDAISNSMNTEMALVKLRHELRDAAVGIGANVAVGHAAIGGA